MSVFRSEDYKKLKNTYASIMWEILNNKCHETLRQTFSKLTQHNHPQFDKNQVIREALLLKED